MVSLIKVCKDLLIKDPFYGFFFLSIQKLMVPEDHAVKTAAIGPNGINFTLYINEKFWNTLSYDDAYAILKHELLHLCFFHCTENFDSHNQQAMNIAMDIEVNQYLDYVPASAVTLDKVQQEYNIKLKPKAGSWYYYKKLLEVKQDNDINIPNTESIDDHSMWPKNMSAAEKELLNNQLKYKLKETAEHMIKVAGNVPGEMHDILKSIQTKDPVFNWKRYFRRLVGNSITNELLLTRMRPSKRFPDAKGIRMKRKPNILVGVDTSGSVSNTELSEFFAEIHHIYKSGVNVTVVECDTQIQNIFEYKGKQEIKISGRGGTIMSPIIEYYKKHKEFSSCVLFTDGYCETEMPLCKNLIWVITPSGNKSTKYSPGQTIFIPKS